VSTDISNLIKWEYWLDAFKGDNPTLTSPVISNTSFFFSFFLYFFSAIAIAGFALVIYKHILPKSHPFKKSGSIITGHLITLGLLGLLWFLCRELSIGLVGSRLMLLIGGLYTFGAITYFFRVYWFFFAIELKHYRLHNKKIAKKMKEITE
jgi:hypothetical protein